MLSGPSSWFIRNSLELTKTFSIFRCIRYFLDFMSFRKHSWRLLTCIHLDWQTSMHEAQLSTWDLSSITVTLKMSFASLMYPLISISPVFHLLDFLLRFGRAFSRSFPRNCIWEVNFSRICMSYLKCLYFVFRVFKVSL